MKPNPNYSTPVGEVSPATAATLGYAVPSFIVAVSLVYGTLEHGSWFSSSIGTALWIGGIVFIVAAASVRSYYLAWGESS